MATKKKKKSALDDINSSIVFPELLSKEFTERVTRAQTPGPWKEPETSTFYKDWAPIKTVTTDDDEERFAGDLISPLYKEDSSGRSWLKQSSLLRDGRDKGDIAKTILGTMTDLDSNMKAGLLGIGEKVIDAGVTGIATVSDALGNKKFAKKARTFVEKDLYDERKIASNPMIAVNPLSSVSYMMGLDAEDASVLGDKADDLAYSGGQLLGTMALQAAGVPWFVTTGATSFGSEAETALREGADYKEAALRGGISAGAEILSERLFGGIKFGGKTLDDALIRPLTEKISSKVVRNLVNVGIDATGEGFEEIVSSVVNNLGEKLYNEDAKIKDLLLSEQAMDEYIEGFIGGAILGGGAGAGKAIAATKAGRDYKTGLTDNEQQVVDAEVKNRIAEKEKDNQKLSRKEKATIEEQVQKDLKKGYIDIDTIESTLGGDTYKSYKTLLEESEEYETLNKTRAMELTGEQSDRLAALKEKNKATSYESEKVRLKEQLFKEVDGLTQADKFLRESYNEKSRRGQAYEVDLTQYKSETQKEVVQKAVDSKILNNTRRTHEFVDMISKIAADKGVSFDFTNNEKLKESGFAVDGKAVNGYVQGNTISLNIQSAKSLNKVVGHEITHVLEGTELYTELQKVVKDYATTKGEYSTRLESLQEMYKDIDGAVAENELTADLIGDYLFTDEAFVNNLSAKNPNVFKKVYDEIKYLVKTATAGSKEARELEKVKRVFEKAYKQKSVSVFETKYHLSSSFSQSIDDALNGEMPSQNQVKARDFTPKILVKHGVKDLPMLITQKHIKTIIYTEAQAKHLGLPVNDKTHYHGLGKQLLMDAIDNMDTPQEIYKKNDEQYVIITELKDQEGNTIIVPVKVDGKGVYNNVYIDENHILSAYGKKNLQAYLSRNKFTCIYKKGTALNELGQSQDISDPSMVSISDSQKKTTNLKEKQLEIVLNSNPMQDSYHTGIRSIDDILTFEEALNSDDYIDYKGEDFDESYPYSAAEKALSTGKIIVYSSYPIEQGVFVSPSYMEAQSYSGNGQVYSKEVVLTDVAWINPTQGQIAVTDGNTDVQQSDGVRYALEINISDEISNFGITNKMNDYIGIQKAVIPVLESEGYFGEVTNAETGKVIEITKKGIKETLSSGKRFQTLPRTLKELKLATIRKLPEIIRDAHITEDNVKNKHGESSDFAYFEIKTTINSAPVTISLDVKKTSAKNKFWIHHVDITKENSQLLSSGQSQNINEIGNSFEGIIAHDKENASKKSLSQEGKQDIAPIGNYNVYGKDVILEAPIRSDLLDTTITDAPIRSDMKQNNPEVRHGYKPLTEDQANTRDQERLEAETAPGISNVATNRIARDLKEVLPFVMKGQVKRVEGMIKKYAESENPDPNELYMELKEEFSHNTVKRKLEDVAAVQSVLRRTQLAISDSLKAQIPDYNDMRKSVFGRLRLSSSEGIAVDTAYQELSMAYPEFFPDDIVNQADQLERIVEVAKESRYYDEVHEADGKQLAEATRRIMDQVEEYKKSKEERERRKKESRSYLHASIMENFHTAFQEKGMDLDEVLDSAKTLPTLATVDNTPQRVNEKTFGYKAGQLISELTVEQVARNETDAIKWLNSYTDKKTGVIAQLANKYGIKPGSKESAAAQMYGEGFYTNDKKEVVKYGDRELALDFPDPEVQERIKGLATDQTIRQIYDETLERINESRTRNAYEEIPRRNNYFLHFRAMDDAFSKIGIPFNPNQIKAKDLPTDMNGETADLKPGQPYFASANQRKGTKTSYDILGGLERYLNSAKNQIFHIDDIQTGRAFRNYVANRFGQATGIENIDQMTDEEAETLINLKYKAHLSTYARFLTEQANVLAGKTSMIDRGFEGIFGRRGLSVLNTINSQVATNMIGFNLSSSLTNLVSVVQGAAKANSKASVLKAFAQTASNKVQSIYGRSDGFAEQNPLIIRRKGAQSYSRTPWQKISDTGFIFMSAIDDVATECIVRSKYNELVDKKGMDSDAAHAEASKWAARILGDRSYGQQPLLYNSKLLGIATKFQLEVRNQLDSMFYDTIQESKLSVEDMEEGFAKNAKIAAKVASKVTQLAVFQGVFGAAFESIAGYDPTFNMLQVIMMACGFDDDDDSEDTPADNLEQAFQELLGDLPYTSTFTGGRVPISSGLPIEQLLTRQDDYGNEKPRWETLLEALPYYIVSTGYGQIKKTYQGLSMFSDDLPISGSYTKNTPVDKIKGEDPGNLRFPVANTLRNKVQAGIFGQWANENARNYFDNGRAPLKDEQIQEYKDLDMPISDYWEYREGLAQHDTLAEKADYINSLDLPISKKNIMINNVAGRKEAIDMTGYNNFANFEEFDYSIKNPEKYQFLKDNDISYKDYMSDETQKEEIDQVYSWVHNNPEKYTVSKAVTDDVFEYKEYTNTINAFRADKNKNGKSISGTAKKKVVAYIDSLDIDDGAKYIMFKQKYPSNNSYNTKIIDYLNNRDDISREDMITILEELKMHVDEDGTVRW